MSALCASAAVVNRMLSLNGPRPCDARVSFSFWRTPASNELIAVLFLAEATGTASSRKAAASTAMGRTEAATRNRRATSRSNRIRRSAAGVSVSAKLMPGLVAEGAPAAAMHTTAVLLAVHRLVGDSKQAFLDRRVADGFLGEPDAGSDGDRLSGGHERQRIECLPNGVRNVSTVDPRGRREENAELVAAQPGDDGSFGSARTKLLCDLTEELVARSMTVVVVDLLEVVEVDEKEHERVGAGRGCECLELLVEATSVQAARKIVV